VNQKKTHGDGFKLFNLIFHEYMVRRYDSSCWSVESGHGDDGDENGSDLCRNNIQLFYVGTRI
jgi:hypothetical protein